MNMSSLKIIAGIAISESSNYTKLERIEILKFIKEKATEHELKALILDGKIPPKMTNDTINLIETRFNSIKVDDYIVEIVELISNGKILTEYPLSGVIPPKASRWSSRRARDISATGGSLKKAAGRLVGAAGTTITKTARTGAGLAAVAAIPVGIWAGVRIIKASMDEKKRRCGVFSIGKSRSVCLLKVEIEGYNKQIAAMKQIKDKCQQQADPDLCINKIMPKIDEMERKIAQAHAQLASLAKQGTDMTTAPGTLSNPNAMRLR